MAFLGMSIDKHVEILEMQFGRWTEKSSEIDHIYRKDKLIQNRQLTRKHKKLNLGTLFGKYLVGNISNLEI